MPFRKLSSVKYMSRSSLNQTETLSSFVDDCWAQGRDSKTSQFVANTTRFPQGMKAIADYSHSKGVKFGLYTAESPNTCAGYPASAGYEGLDAKTFAEWGVGTYCIRSIHRLF